MDTIGLYDIDFWHTVETHVPNIELMHYYSYYLRAGQRPILLEKNSKQFYNKIIYFKDNPTFIPPMGLQMSGDNVQINGYGFFKNENYIPEEILKTPIDYTPYDVFSDRIKHYDIMRRSALIRISNDDLLELNVERKNKRVFVVDRDLIGNQKILDFLNDNKQYTYYFIHKLIFNNLQDYLSYKNLNIKTNNHFIIDFPYNLDLLNNADKRDTFIIKKQDKEKNSDFLLRLTKTYLFALLNKERIKFVYSEWTSDIESLTKWQQSAQNSLSYYEYCKNNKINLIKSFNSLPTELRILLKTKPNKLSIKDIDF